MPSHPSPTPARTRHRGPLAALALCCAVALGLGDIATAPPAAAQSSFTFTGSGWGHGVGMSQWGARGMAATGNTYDQILQHYYTGASVVSQPVSNDLRVLIAQQAPTLALRTGGATRINGHWDLPAGTTITLSRTGNQVRMSGAVDHTVDAVTVQYAGHGELTVTPGHSYRYGSLTVRADPTGGLRAVIGGLSMQHYLYGLGEMPSSWPAEALKAQATAGRTFAQKRRNARGSADFDLYGSVLHQAYTGTKWQAPNWTNAVDATAGRVITAPGHGLIDAVYSASSGGHTEHSEIVWVTPVSYLRARPDPHDAGGGNPHASWSRTYSGAQLGSWFGLGTVTSVQILGPLSPSGRVDKATIRVRGTGGTKDMSGTAFRSTVNSKNPLSSQLMSTKFTVADQAAWRNTMPTGSIDEARSDGRRVIIGGRANDPDGSPLVRVVSTMGSQRAVRDLRPTNGTWQVSWTGAPGTRNVCVTVYDVPTGQGVSLGCRDIVVK